MRPWLAGNTFGDRKLAHVGKLKARIGWQNLRSDEFVDEGPHCVTGTDFARGEVNWSTAYRVTPERYTMDDNIHLEEDDLLITKDGTIGKVAVVRDMPGPATLNSGVFLLRAQGEGFHSPYMKWVVLSKVFNDFVAFTSTGSTINHLYQNVFEKFRFPYPDLETQKTIADFLDRETARIDQLIEKKERLLSTLKQAHSSATMRVMKDGFSELGYDGAKNKVVFKGLQTGWHVRRIKHLVSHMTSGSRGWSEYIQESGELFLQSGCITDRMSVATADAPRITPQVGAEAARTSVKPNDVLVCITGGRTGAVGFVSKLNETAYVNQHVCLLRPNTSVIWPRLLAQLLFSEIGQLQFSMFQYGLKQGLGFDEVANTAVLLPPRELQAEISSQIDRESEKTEQLSKKVGASVDLLNEARSALITAAVTGQIDVTTWGKQGSTDRRLDQIEEEISA